MCRGARGSGSRAGAQRPRYHVMEPDAAKQRIGLQSSDACILDLCVNHLLSITQRLRVRGAQASVPEAPLGLCGQGDRSGLRAVQLWQFELTIDVKTTLSQTKAGRQSHVLPSLCLPLFATLHVSEFSYFTVYTTHACPCRLLKRPR